MTRLWTYQPILCLTTNAMLGKVLGMEAGEGLRNRLGVNVRNQFKSAAFATAGALMRSRASSDSDGDFESTGIIEMVSATVATAVACLADLGTCVPIPHFRRPKAHRNRPRSLEFIRSWDDRMLPRQIRVQQEDSHAVLGLIHGDLEGNQEMAISKSS
jgi:hypothetical protein